MGGMVHNRHMYRSTSTFTPMTFVSSLIAVLRKVLCRYTLPGSFAAGQLKDAYQGWWTTRYLDTVSDGYLPAFTARWPTSAPRAECNTGI